jgi:nucleoid-associated protein YgaU
MDVPVLFDGWSERINLESAISTLFQMSVGSDYSPPPTVKITGGVPIKNATWVINGIDWGTDVIWGTDGPGTPYRLRQDAVVHLIQYNPERDVKILTTKSLPNIYIVHRKGETMRTIAKAMYGDARRWTKIKAANPSHRDPNHLKVGTKLRIP